MRVAFVVLLAVAAVVVSDSTPPAPLAPEQAIAAALAHLASTDAEGVHVLEALVAAGQDPRTWDGRDILHTVTVPPPGGDPVGPLREAYAVLSAGADPHAWDDPRRGQVDLAAELLANAPAAHNSSNDAATSFQLLAMAAGDLLAAPPGDAWREALRDRLLQLQAPTGAWGCGPWHGPECTGFALAALHASGGIPADVGQRAAQAIFAWRGHGGFADPLAGHDVQVEVWAVQALRLASDVGAVAGGTHALAADEADAAQARILRLQRGDGAWSVDGRPSAWATAEAVVMLAGGHPLRG